MFAYARDVFYYETDQMGVVHHSNFIRWLEEARIAFFTHTGLSYAHMETLGVLSPIINCNVQYKYFARFGDHFTVRLQIPKYTGVRFQVHYTVVNQNQTILLEGETAHAFVNTQYRPISLAKAAPDLHNILKNYVTHQQQ